MLRYITNIKVKHLLHLKDFEIALSDDSAPHLLITGKNGSGKTVLLNEIARVLDIVKKDKRLDFLGFEKDLQSSQKRLAEARTDKEIANRKESVLIRQRQLDNFSKSISFSFSNVRSLVGGYNAGKFIIAFYEADRKVKMTEPKAPQKPKIEKFADSKKTNTEQFLHFLVNLKVQAAMASNEGQQEDAEVINQWFDSFEKIVGDIYEDKNLKLKFNYKDYSFTICTEGKEFSFNQMSDGFAAVMDIVADLILRMQDGDGPVREYKKPGIVLIDEIETHLHLELQKHVLPLLTRLFPNIQFIVSTHSPFVLSSMPNAVAFDLEHKVSIDDLTDYSYEALAEGYFKVDSTSSYAKTQLDELEKLLAKNALSLSEKSEVRTLVNDFKMVPEMLSPSVAGRFQQILTQYSDRVKEVME